MGAPRSLKTLGLGIAWATSACVKDCPTQRLESIKHQIRLDTFSFEEEFPDYRLLHRLSGERSVHAIRESSHVPKAPPATLLSSAPQMFGEFLARGTAAR